MAIFLCYIKLCSLTIERGKKHGQICNELVEKTGVAKNLIKVDLHYTIGALRSEGKTDEEILEECQTEKILKTFPRCKECGGFHGECKTVSMCLEFDPNPAEIFCCSKCGNVTEI